MNQPTEFEELMRRAVAQGDGGLIQVEDADAEEGAEELLFHVTPSQSGRPQQQKQKQKPTSDTAAGGGGGGDDDGGGGGGDDDGGGGSAAAAAAGAGAAAAAANGGARAANGDGGGGGGAAGGKKGKAARKETLPLPLDLCERLHARLQQARQELVVMLLSSKAGSLGINLTSAWRMVLFDVPWNPVWNAQAIARIYRFGQTHPTFVYRLLYAATLEERVYDQTVDKEELFSKVVDRKQVRKAQETEIATWVYNPPARLPPEAARKRLEDLALGVAAAATATAATGAAAAAGAASGSAGGPAAAAAEADSRDLALLELAKVMAPYSWVLSTSACSASRSGVNQKPLYTSSA
ncbi:Transcriptional regulator ATRX [Tetrabaena socialis]|uniref:Transcriptional regulator ATRX n=1 Tax=Tetrabaena socialis TaxID=47790 RepID=A0A2J8A1S9_9CHLO|nr:Transcriptional regulator ATRX [Tetrabaena socialis]|eukprot:PNH06473.1 Transcriptional regulator ATRX [Tetrabaena socialis]